MGRQHTTWISDETWEQMKRIPGESVSERFRNAVKFADPTEGMRLRSIERRHDTIVEALTRINEQFQRLSLKDGWDKARSVLINIDDILTEVEWIWWEQ